VATRRLIAVTRDAGLGTALQELAAEVSIVIVQDLQALTDEMLQHGSTLALLDAAAIEQPLDAVVDSLTSQFPDVRVMIAGQAREQSLLASRIANEAVFRFVHKPASPQRLKLFLEAASREGVRRRGPAIGTGSATPRPPSKLALTLACLAAVSVAAAAAWVFWPQGAAARLNARDLGKVEVMLQQADAAMGAGRFASFDGTSAAELYRDVLQLDAVNEPARAGLEKAVGSAVGAARQALTEGQLDAATNNMEAVRLIAPQHTGLKELVTQVETETRRQLADSKARQAMQERQAQIQAAVTAMQASIRAGTLLEPVTDNAITRFQSAQSLSPGDAAVRSARSELTTALVSAGENALAAGRMADARRHAAAAGRINSSAADLGALLRKIEAAAAPAPATSRPTPASSTPVPEPDAVATAPVTAAPPPADAIEPPVVTQEPELAAPAPPAEPVPVPGEDVIWSRQLKVLRKVELEYPQDAQARGITGWVELEFTVALDGSVKDVKVTAAEPRRTFDAAAIAAQRRARYAPVLRDGQPVEQRGRTRIVFDLKDGR
jgi:TonB family protein